MSTPTPTPGTTCPPDMSDQVDELTKNLQYRDQLFLQQQKQLQQLQSNIPSIKQDVYTIKNNLQTHQQIVRQEHRHFYVSVIALVLLGMFWLLIYLYNQLLTNRVMPILRKSGIFLRWIDVFTSGARPVDPDDTIRRDVGEWNELMAEVNRYISRSRFFLMCVVFGLVMGGTMILYSLIYHGSQPADEAAKRVALCTGLVLGFTFLFVNNTSMIRPFEQGVGYNLLALTSHKFLVDTMKSIFQHKYFTSRHVFPGADVYYDFMMNTFSLTNIPEVLDEVYYHEDRYDFAINTRPGDEGGITKTDLENLFKYVLQKHTIGHSCWIYFASLTSVIISIQYLFAMG